MKSLILEGFMGCGKSSIAEQLSKELNCPLYDTDALIEKDENRSINEIFESSGEEYFRDLETKMLEKLMQQDGFCVISLGGGMPVREENRKLLRKLGTVVYIKAPAELLFKRLENEREKRPMLEGHELRQRIDELLRLREEAYLKAADFTMGLREEMTVKDAALCIRKACGI